MRNRRVSLGLRYAVASALFWAIALVVVNQNGPGFHAEPLGAALNLLLLPALWRESELARTVLVLEGGAAAIFLGVGGLVLHPEPAGALAVVAVYQVVVLWQIGRSWNVRRGGAGVVSVTER